MTTGPGAIEGFTYVGTLTWARSGNGEVYRCDRCRALTDDQGGHDASHTLEDAAVLRAIKAIAGTVEALADRITPGAFKASTIPADLVRDPRPSRVAAWRESAGLTVVNPDVEP